MIAINNEIIKKIYEQGMNEFPFEACGYLAGKDAKVTKHYPMENIDKSAEHFSLDPKEQFSVVRDVRAQGLELIAVYHTHPTSPARPSDEDIRLAFDPNIIYVIVSLLNNAPALKAYRIVNGIANVEVIVTI